MTNDLSYLVEEAYKRIKPYILRTPLEYSFPFSELLGCNVYLKTENYQLTGSFKVRGALNKILQLAENGKDEVVVAASTGNHAAAVGYALQKVGMTGIIFLPENVSKTKVDKLRNFSNVSLEYFGNDSIETELEAKKFAAHEGFTYVSPYNDIDIIAGQGTIGYEILGQLGDMIPQAVFVPVGGGGLISGIAGYLDEKCPETKIIGCQPENSSVMHQSVLKGKILDIPSKPTVSDGTAGGVEQNSLTFPYCTKLVDEWIEVSETEIMKSMEMILSEHNMLIEGASGLALASLIKRKNKFINQNVVLILCGNKISKDLLSKIVSKFDST